MSRDERLDELISAWLLDEAPREVPDRVLHETFERTGRTRQQLGWRARLRRVQMPASNGARISMVMGATAIAAILGYTAWSGPLSAPGDVGGGTTPPIVPTATPPAPTPSPGATPNAVTRWSVTQPFFVEATLDVPLGWSRQDVGQDMAGTNRRSWDSVLFLTTGVHIYAHPCQPGPPEFVEVGPTTDDLVAALAEVQVDVSPVTETTVDGYPARQLTLSAPDEGGCEDGEYLLWRWLNGYDHGVGPVGETRVYVVDVEGTRAMVVLEDRGTPEESAELDRVFESLRLSPAPAGPSPSG
jgi:hypothetical protein